MEDFQKALQGEITTDEWDAEKLVGYHKFVSDKAKEEEGKVAGLREAKRTETERVEKLKKEAEDAVKAVEEAKKGAVIETPKPKDNPTSPELTQFRSEQVEKARNRIFSEIELTDEEKEAVDEKFKKLDSGKLDADFIYNDFKSALVATKADTLLELEKESKIKERAAEKEIEQQALAGGNTPPAEGQPKKYSDEVENLAKEAGISEEAAQRQVLNGMNRVIG